MAVVDLGGQAEHEGQGLDVAVGDAAGVGAQDAAGERGVLVVLDQPSGRGLGVNVVLTVSGPAGLAGCDVVCVPVQGVYGRSCGGPVAASRAA